VLLVLIILEAALLGSGRLIQFGPLTLKMWLFVAAQLYVLCFFLWGGNVRFSSTLLVSSLVCLIFLAVAMGLTLRAELALVFEDAKPLIYFAMLIFFDITICKERHVATVVTIIKVSALLMSVAYLITVGLLWVGFLSFADVYSWYTALSDQEFMFRGETGLFMYKGALYIFVGMIFFAFGRGIWSRIALVLTLVGGLATGTRGLMVALCVVLLLHVMTSNAGIRSKAVVVTVALGMGIALLLGSSRVLGDKTDSDYVRIETAQQVADSITPASIVIGNGFGRGVEVRPVHMEASYLEIFHKQGLLGLTWWTAVLAVLAVRYRLALRTRNKLVQPLFLVVGFVVVESFTNPFINNPIGMSVLLISLSALGLIARTGLQLSTRPAL
jgi:hypothetical protein